MQQYALLAHFPYQPVANGITEMKIKTRLQVQTNLKQMKVIAVRQDLALQMVIIVRLTQ